MLWGEGRGEGREGEERTGEERREMQELLDPVEYAFPPNTPAPFL